MPQPVGGLFDVGFDYKMFCADPDLRLGIEKIAAAAERATKTPLNIDKTIIDGIVASIELQLANAVKVNPSGPLVVGAMAPNPTAIGAAKGYLSMLETSNGHVFSQAVKAKIAAHPEIIDLIRHRPQSWQVKFLESSWLDTVIGWVETYWPQIVQALMLIIPLFL